MTAICLPCNQVGAVTDFDETGANDGRVQTQFPAEPPNDLTQNVRILRCRVRIVRRHHAAASKVGKSDLRVGQPKNRTRPLSLGETSDAPDDQIRTQASDVVAERRHRAIGANKQRQDIETLSTVESLQARSRPDRRLDALLHLTRTPWQSIDQRFSVDAESGVKLKQAGERSSGDHPPAPIVDLHDTIAEEACVRQLRGSNTLPRHGLHGITPNRSNRHFGSDAELCCRCRWRLLEVGAIDSACWHSMTRTIANPRISALRLDGQDRDLDGFHPGVQLVGRG